MGFLLEFPIVTMPPELLQPRADGGWGVIDFLLRLEPSVALRPLNVEVSTGDYPDCRP